MTGGLTISMEFWLTLEVCILLVLALASEIKQYKITNTVTLTFIVIGIATKYLFFGLSGAIQSIGAALLPVIFLLILFALRMLGAGDIKLFSAIGSITGVEFIFYTIAYSFLWGGLISLVIIYVRKNGKQRLIYLFNYIRACFLSRSLLQYSDFKNKGDGAKFRFSYAILCGTLTQAAMIYFL